MRKLIEIMEQQKERMDLMINQTLEANLRFLEVVNKDLLPTAATGEVRGMAMKTAERLIIENKDTLQLMRLKKDFEEKLEIQIKLQQASKAVELKKCQSN